VDNTSQLPDLGIGNIDTIDIYSLRICKGKKLTGVLVAKWYFLNAFALGHFFSILIDLKIFVSS
jgi:hypothetical protein